MHLSFLSFTSFSELNFLRNSRRDPLIAIVEARGNVALLSLECRIFYGALFSRLIAGRTKAYLRGSACFEISEVRFTYECTFLNRSFHFLLNLIALLQLQSYIWSKLCFSFLIASLLCFFAGSCRCCSAALQSR